jgi:hypothetical protein
MPESITDLVIRIEKTIDEGDTRTCIILCDQILKQDFNNSYAWERMFEFTQAAGDLQGFKVRFARTYYPDRFHQLELSEEAASATSPFLTGTNLLGEDIDPRAQSEMVRDMAEQMEQTELPEDLRNEYTEQLMSTIPNERIAAIREIRHLGLIKCLPALVFLAKKSSQTTDSTPGERELLIDTLAEVGGTEFAHEILNLRRYPSFTKADVLHIARTLNQMGKGDLALEAIDRGLNPEAYSGLNRNTHLDFIMEAGTLSSPETVELLCKNLMREKRFWNQSQTAALVGLDNALEPLVVEADRRGPIAPVRGAKARELADAQTGKSAALLEVTESLINPFMIASYSPGMLMLLTYHCYVTALRHIGLSNNAILLMDVTNRKNTLEQAAIALAMAQLGNRSAWPSFETLRRDPDWAVRVLSYEGMILLADLLHIDVDAMQLASLKDKDPRVSLACAYLMLLTRREDYEAPILVMAESLDAARREAYLGPLAWMARNGNEKARAKLAELAREDPDERVRTAAGLHQIAISPKRGRVSGV